MINKIRLQKNLDLIKIYESGKLEELELLLKEMKDKNEVFVKTQRYYYKLIVNKDIDMNEIYNDPLFPLFKNYADKFLGAKVKCFDIPKNIEKQITNKEALDFYNKYFNRRLKNYSFKTTIEEAYEYGKEEIIDFLETYNNVKGLKCNIIN